MRKSVRSVGCAAVAAAMLFALAVPAGAAPLAPLPERTLPSRSGSGVAPAAHVLPANDIATAMTLPASPVNDTLPASTVTNPSGNGIQRDVYEFTLNVDQVLHATITQTLPTTNYVNAYGFLSDAGSANPDDPNAVGFPNAFAEGYGVTEIFIAAEYGTDTYYLDIENMSTSAAMNYQIDWEILDKPATANTPERIGGADRYAVAANVGAEAFPGWAGVTDIIVACGEDRAQVDPMCAAGMAGAYRAPVLLTRSVLESGKLRGATESAIAAIKAANGGSVNIHVVGGTLSVPSAVYNRLSSLKGPAGTIERINGKDRYDLSVQMAKRAKSVAASDGVTVDAVLIANGENTGAFYDTLAASPISYANVMPTLLSKTSSVPAVVTNSLATDFPTAGRYLISKPAYLTSAVKTATGAEFNIVLPTSASRYEAAYDIAAWGYLNQLLLREDVAVTNKLPDALTGGVAMGEIGGPVLYCSTTVLDFPSDLFLYWNKGGYTNSYVFGGTASVQQPVLDEMDFNLFY